MLAIITLMTTNCSSNHREFGKTPSGETVELYTLKNAKGMEADISTYGGVVVALKAPDRNGALGDVVLGFDNFQGYLLPPPYFGALDRPVRQPHRARQIHAGRGRISPGEERWRQFPARR